MSDFDALFDSIDPIIGRMQDLQRQAAQQYKPVVDDFQRSRCRDAKQIEHTLSRWMTCSTSVAANPRAPVVQAAAPPLGHRPCGHRRLHQGLSRALGQPKSAGARMSEELLLYQAPDGSSRIQVRLEGRTLWLTQQQLADLYESTPQNITQHIRAIYTESELIEAATCKPYLQVRDEAGRQVSRSLKHYNLDVVIAIGYRVRSHRGTQFRRWATDTLRDFLVKGFVLDDERFKGGHDDAYFEELLARIRDIRSSEKVFWKKVLDIYATSIGWRQ